MNLIPIGTQCYHAGDFLSSTEVVIVNEENQKIVSALWNELYFTDKAKADYVTELAHAEYSDWQGYCIQT